MPRWWTESCTNFKHLLVSCSCLVINALDILYSNIIIFYIKSETNYTQFKYCYVCPLFTLGFFCLFSFSLFCFFFPSSYLVGDTSLIFLLSLILVSMCSWSCSFLPFINSVRYVELKVRLIFKIDQLINVRSFSNLYLPPFPFHLGPWSLFGLDIN